ncbi:MAG: formylglycine-generating enzyme family protein [Planctomycetota bacterium]
MRRFLIPVLALILAACAAAGADEKSKPSTDGMILVPAGEFSMGTDVPEGEKPTNESPKHKVTLDAFYISKYEVTNAEYAKFIDAKGYEKKEHWSEAGWKWLAKAGRKAPEEWEKLKKGLGDEFGEHPVVGISWYEADAYSRWAGKRLPTEAEWERAARGTDGRKFPWGEEFEQGLRKKPPEEKGRTTKKGLNRGDVSAVGAHDMGANVCEWTATEYGPYPGTKMKSRYWPQEGGKAAKRRLKVARGGSWRVIDEGPRPQPHKCRCAYRQVQYFPDDGYPFIGFRLAMDVPKKKDAAAK